jgi:hypothetical protein
MVQLRRALWHLGERAVDRLDDGGIVAVVARRMHRGAVRLRELPPPPFDARALQGLVAEREDEENVLGPEPETTWIEVRLVGEDAAPIQGQLFRVELPDGTFREGVLDRHGVGRIDGIERPGACRITFPLLDEEAWEPLDA